jgi:hypothetical protein
MGAERDLVSDMSRYSDEEREAIMAETRANLQPRERNETEPVQDVAYEPPDEDALAEALRQPLETHNQRVAREITEQEERWAKARARRERTADRTLERELAKVRAEFTAKIEARENVLYEAVGKFVAEREAEERKETKNALSDEVRTLRTELLEVKTTLLELRQAMATGSSTKDRKSEPEILPALPSLRRVS